MKTQMRVVLTLLAAFAVLEGASRLLAQETTGPARRKALNPSQAFPTVNPSRTVREAPPVDPGFGGGPRALAPTTLPITTQVFISIAEGPNQLKGLPSFGNAGISVRNLRVETDRGSVVLLGGVPTEADRALAGLRAEEIAGRGKVINRLSVSR